ncbi:hypothetical protein [Microbulbifer magnicolonia]|uniref:hypothetical protein n=1 Tax=Microbulbifer magnicolonia TaxID=3109744 RepID=UPI002B411BF8|nr:hypothetical protein [Microbulbifer sp. GG15]
MKKVILSVLLSLSLNVQAWECGSEQQGIDTPINKHIEFATEIYMGRVINSYLVEEIDKVVFELKVSELFKGRYKNHVTLFTSSNPANPEISIGNSYIVFLYGSNDVNFCGVTINLGYINNLDLLKDQAENGRFEQRQIEQIRALLAYKGAQP